MLPYKKIVTFIMTIALVCSVTITAFAAGISYSDVTSADWFYEEVQSLAASGAIAGYSDGTFKPQNTISRAEFTKILVIALCVKQTTRNYFSDTENMWASDYISSAVASGIIVKAEYGDYYDPNTPITRLEIAKMLVRALNIDSSSSTNAPFVDTTDQFVHSVYNEKLVNGVNVSGIYYFYPYGNATRAEASVMLVRAIEYKADPVAYKATAADHEVNTQANNSTSSNTSKLWTFTVNGVTYTAPANISAMHYAGHDVQVSILYVGGKDYSNYIVDDSFDGIYDMAGNKLTYKDGQILDANGNVWKGNASTNTVLPANLVPLTASNYAEFMSSGDQKCFHDGKYLYYVANGIVLIAPSNITQMYYSGHDITFIVHEVKGINNFLFRVDLAIDEVYDIHGNHLTMNDSDYKYYKDDGSVWQSGF